MIEAAIHPSPRIQRALVGLRLTAAGVTAWLVAGLVHEVLVLLMAAALPGLATSWLAEQFVRLAPISRIYAQAMVDMLGAVAPVGLALSAPIGVWLNGLSPALFVLPDDAGAGGWAAAIVAPGSTLPARLLISTAADVVVLASGLALTARGMAAGQTSGRPSSALAIGLGAQALVVATALRAPLTAADLEAAGALPFLFHELLHLPTAAYDRTIESLARWQSLITLASIAGLYVSAAGPIGLSFFLFRFRRRKGPGQMADGAMQSPVATARIVRRSPLTDARPRPLSYGVAIALAMALAVTPLGDLLMVETRFLDTEPVVAGERASEPGEVTGGAGTGSPTGPTTGPMPDFAQRSPAVASSVEETLAPTTMVPVSRQPVTVRVAGRDGQFAYYVGGVKTTIRAMGYNVQYVGLPAAERAARYRRDFAALRHVGVNTVAGWRPAEFDEVLLDAATRAGLGVMMPYQLDPGARYGEPAVRRAITNEVLAWIDRHRGHPAVRAWAIGNETLMEIKDRQKAQAFAEFYADLVLAVLDADPSHPVIYRDAEDVYLPALRDAMAKRGGPPLGFVYGMNFYTFRLRDVLAEWPKKKFDAPVLVSEFAPAGLSRHDRPDGFRRMWSIIQAHGAFIVGAAPYVWTTEGPEPVDRLFGFVDTDGRPLDGVANTFRDLYRLSALQDGIFTAVPALVGLTEGEALRLLANIGLAVAPTEYLPRREVRDPLLKGRAVPGRVFVQQPGAGVTILPEVRVKLTVIAPEPPRRLGRFLQ